MPVIKNCGNCHKNWVLQREHLDEKTLTAKCINCGSERPCDEEILQLIEKSEKDDRLVIIVGIIVFLICSFVLIAKVLLLI